MDSSEKKRKLLIGAALVATLLAAVMVEKEEAEDDSVKTVEPTQIPRTSKERAAQKQENITEALDVSKLGQRKFNPKAGELFVTTNWAPKPPPIDPEEQAASSTNRASRTFQICWKSSFRQTNMGFFVASQRESYC